MWNNILLCTSISVGISGVVSAIVTMIKTRKMMKGGWSASIGYQPRESGLPEVHCDMPMPKVKVPRGGTGQSQCRCVVPDMPISPPPLKSGMAQPEKPIPSGIRVIKENGKMVHGI